jgi:hypothetical protein
MSDGNTLSDFMELVKKNAPQYYDLVTAKSEAEFERAFLPYLESAITSLEKNKKVFNALSEDGLSSIVSIALNQPGLTCTRETNCNGHVDLTIVAHHCIPVRTKLGEAKIYNGPAYHIKGVAQLLNRYTTGREACGLLLNYVKQPDIKGLIMSLRKAMDTQMPHDQKGRALNSHLRWTFLTTHSHSSGENLDICHVGCNLYLET